MSLHGAAPIAESARLVEQLPMALAVLDQEMRFVSVSPEFAFVVGPDRSAIVGRPYEELLPGFPHDFQAVFQTVLRTGTSLKGDEEHFFKTDGKPDRILWELHPWRSQDGSVAGAILVLEVVTRRMQFEELAQRSIKNETVATLCHSFGTEMRNLMILLDGYVERLIPSDDDTPDPEAKRAASNGLRQGLAHANEMAENLRALGHSKHLLPQPTDLAEFLPRAVAEIRASAPDGIEVKFVTQAGNWHCLIDPIQLKRTVLAIAANGIEAMPKGGDLTVFLSSCNERQLTFCIADSGVGMTDDVLQQAADPFFSTRKGGCFRGLGLSLAFGFVTHSNGDLRIVSVPRKGTRVYVTLPFHDWDWIG